MNVIYCGFKSLEVLFLSYGVLGKFLMMTITKRESFIIDPKGVIVKHYKSVDPEKHTDEVIEELKLLQKRA